MSTTLENLSNIILENKLDQSESSDDKQDQKNEAFEFMIAKLTQKDIGKFITYSSLFKKYTYRRNHFSQNSRIWESVNPWGEQFMKGIFEINE